MEITFEAPDDVFATFRRQKITTVCSPSVPSPAPENRDIIDSSQLIFSSDENWLCECSNKSHTDLQKWLYQDDPKPPKNIDTRTFTRPKKRFTRPSVEKYNEDLYGSDVKELTDSGIHLNGCSQDVTPTKPLHFELGHTATSVYFDKMVANAPMMDSFQNMSPPSLVNSMCSSTFATLMESSFIKNDPVLREIRDTDYTGSILQQEAEPMFQSITESCSSLNSDVPENFLKKVAFSEEQGEDLDETVVMNATFAKGDDPPCDQTMTLEKRRDEDFQDAKATIHEDLNSTYQRKVRYPDAPLNSTFQRRKSTKSTIESSPDRLRPDLNSTITIEREKNRSTENVKRLLDRRPSPSPDLNRLSYLVDKNDHMNATFTNESPKRNSIGSTDSGENLDYMSLSSGSSKSSKMPSSDGINAIDNGERFTNLAFVKKSGLNQVSSTPKPAKNAVTLWSNHEISPIRDRNSDPELSSIEQIQSVIPQNPIRKQKSVGHLNKKIPNPKSLHTLGHFEAKSTIRSSHPNLKMSESKTLQKATNLNSMGHTLKGSYTSLRPTNTNLPVAPPPLDTTVTKAPVAQVPPLSREVPPKSQDAQFVKPQPPRSGLPRPVTGIPRPVSRIPGPRTAKPKSAGQQGRY